VQVVVVGDCVDVGGEKKGMVGVVACVKGLMVVVRGQGWLWVRMGC
jgi:hypothetical protein